MLGQVSDTALTRDVAIGMGANGLPTSFVPGRNLVFLTFAAALAYRRGIKHIVTGVCETDYSGYPDCRDDTVKAMQLALNLGMEARFVLHTPLMWIDKAETWRLAERLGGAALVDLVRDGTHTCYAGDRTHRHDLGLRLRRLPGLRAAGPGVPGLHGASIRFRVNRSSPLIRAQAGIQRREAAEGRPHRYEWRPLHRWPDDVGLRTDTSRQVAALAGTSG